MDILRVMNQVVKGCDRVKIQQYLIFVIVVLTYILGGSTTSVQAKDINKQDLSTSVYCTGN